MNSPLLSVDQYTKARDASMKSGKDGAKVFSSAMSFANQGDFNRKVMDAVQKLQPEIKQYLRTNIGVLLKVYFDTYIGAGREQTRFFKGVELLGAGASPQNFTITSRGFMTSTYCTDESVRQMACAQGSEYLWVTLMGITNVLTTL